MRRFLLNDKTLMEVYMPQPQVRIVSPHQKEQEEKSQGQAGIQDSHLDAEQDFLHQLAEHGTSAEDLEKR